VEEPYHDVAEHVGGSDLWRDPLWRITVRLSALEQALLRCWPVRRLAFVAFAGAAATVATQNFSRLEHSLGVLALAVHYAPEDPVARAAALLHDVGHLPLSHTCEGLAGLDHHVLGAARIRDELGGVLGEHGVDPAEVVAVLDGGRGSVLTGSAGVLGLDHLDGLVRGARSHGRTTEPPLATLARVRLVNGGVHTDAGTAAYLTDLVAAEARWQTSTINAVATGATRHQVAALLEHAPGQLVAEVAGMTDDELWALLLTDPHTAQAAGALRRDPTAWRAVPPSGDVAGARYRVSRLYLDLPATGDSPTPSSDLAFTGLPTIPWDCVIMPPPDISLPQATALKA
jgi:predicted HD phosphohydrolase